MLPELNEETPKFYLEEASALSDEDLAGHMQTGTLDIIIRGSLSEWGSQLESLIHKLEKSVMQWHEESCDRVLVIHFCEDEDEAKIIRLESA